MVIQSVYHTLFEKQLPFLHICIYGHFTNRVSVFLCSLKKNVQVNEIILRELQNNNVCQI